MTDVVTFIYRDRFQRRNIIILVSVDWFFLEWFFRAFVVRDFLVVTFVVSIISVDSDVGVLSCHEPSYGRIDVSQSRILASRGGFFRFR